MLFYVFLMDKSSVVILKNISFCVQLKNKSDLEQQEVE